MENILKIRNKSIRIVIAILLILSNISCNESMFTNSDIGNVYVAKEYSYNPKDSYAVKKVKKDSIYPILAIRIDGINNNRLKVKYRFGYEAIMPVNFIYQKKQGKYISQEKIRFAPRGSEYKKMSLKIKNNREIEMWILDESDVYVFNYTYKDSIDFRTNDDPYYAEDGFELFPRQYML